MGTIKVLLWSFLCKLIDALSNFASFPSPGFCAFGFLLHLIDSVDICLAAVLLSIQLQLLLRKFSVCRGVKCWKDRAMYLETPFLVLTLWRPADEGNFVFLSCK
jgi:hypothetical protein